MQKYLFFDLDDTLVKCSGYYYDVEDVVAKKVLEYHPKLSYDEIRVKFNEKQYENLEKYGYGPKNFECSLMQVSYELIGYEFFEDNLQDFIKDEAKILYTDQVELLNGVEESIHYLYKKGYDMYIITKGIEDLQRKRVEGLSIKQYFKDYSIVKHKLKSDYESILKKYHFQPEECYMIGNSPKGDINEAKKAGLHTIYVPNKDTWSYEEETINMGEPETKVLEEMREIMNIL